MGGVELKEKKLEGCNFNLARYHSDAWYCCETEDAGRKMQLNIKCSRTAKFSHAQHSETNT